MIYPYLTLNDGTEYTHSEMKADGTVLVYVETPDAKDGFHSLVCVLPRYEIRDVIGYSQEEQKRILQRIKKNAHLMIKYAQIEIVYDEEPFYSKGNLTYIKKSVDELRAGKGKKHELIEVDDE